MRSCENWRERMQESCGEYGRELLEHCRHCPACRARLAQLAGNGKPLPEELDRRTLRQCIAAPPHSRRHRERVYFAWGCAAAVLLLAVIWSFRHVPAPAETMAEYREAESELAAELADVSSSLTRIRQEIAALNRESL